MALASHVLLHLLLHDEIVPRVLGYMDTHHAGANFMARLVGRVLSNDAAKVAAGIPKLGAEFLPGKGSFLLVEGGRILRLQGYYIAPDEASAVV